jgi:hypothetical protein
MKEDEICGECRTRKRGEKCVQNYERTRRGEESLMDLDIGEV